MQSKNFLEEQIVTQIEEVLRDRDASTQDIVMSSPVTGMGGENGGDTEMGDAPQSQTHPPPSARKGPAPPKLDRKQVEQRIEEDRERHKRLRESIWAVPQGDYAELDKLWEETSDLGEDDHRIAEEEWQEMQKATRRNCGHQHKKEATGTAAAASSNGRHTEGR